MSARGQRRPPDDRFKSALLPTSRDARGRVAISSLAIKDKAQALDRKEAASRSCPAALSWGLMRLQCPTSPDVTESDRCQHAVAIGLDTLSSSSTPLRG